MRAAAERKSSIAIALGAGSGLLLLLLSFPFGPPLSCAGPARVLCELGSRGFAGFAYRNITDADKDSLKEYLDLMTSAARGDSLPTILRRNPALGKYVNKDKRESYDNYKTRNFKGNPEAVRQIAKWLAKHAN